MKVAQRNYETSNIKGRTDFLRRDHWGRPLVDMAPDEPHTDAYDHWLTNKLSGIATIETCGDYVTIEMNSIIHFEFYVTLHFTRQEWLQIKQTGNMECEQKRVSGSLASSYHRLAVSIQNHLLRIDSYQIAAVWLEVDIRTIFAGEAEEENAAQAEEAAQADEAAQLEAEEKTAKTEEKEEVAVVEEFNESRTGTHPDNGSNARTTVEKNHSKRMRIVASQEMQTEIRETNRNQPSSGNEDLQSREKKKRKSKRSSATY